MNLALALETGVRGITPDKIHPGISTIFAGHSGRPLRLSASDDDLEIRDFEHPQLRLLAHREEKVFSVDLHTKSPQFPGGKHPDLFAGKFVPFALQYFEKLGGLIPFYQSLWWGTSDNYSGWEKAVQRGLLPVDALYETWEGHLKKKLGYSRTVRFEIIENLKRKDCLVTSLAAKSASGY